MLLCADGAKAGVGAEAATGAAASKSASQISLQEARQILGVEADASLEEVLKVQHVQASWWLGVHVCDLFVSIASLSNEQPVIGAAVPAHLRRQ